MSDLPRMLASDMDGTLIPPIGGAVPLDDLRLFRDAVAHRRLELAYVTGRGHDLALRGIARFGLPEPQVLVCDVGTAVYRRSASGVYHADEAYRTRMVEALGGASGDDVVARLSGLEGLELQAPYKQGPFKVSYFVDEDLVEGLRRAVPERVASLPIPPNAVWSHDPHSGRLLLDVLPRGVAKHVALEHVRLQEGYRHDDIVFAGDSGNDFDAFLSGHPAIVVANAPAALKDEVRAGAESARLVHRLYFADAPYAAGVLEGCRHFGAL